MARNERVSGRTGIGAAAIGGQRMPRTRDIPNSGSRIGYRFAKNCSPHEPGQGYRGSRRSARRGR